jgi:nucleotide-binding universal stress UspA family protein
MFNDILLASDGSDHAIHATEKAITLAENNPHTKIEIVYVVDGSTSKTDVLHNWNTLDIEQKRKDKLKLTEQKVKQAGINYKTCVLHGEPGSIIVEYVNKNKFDIVVIGSRGLNSLQEMVLGSVSHKVAKRAACPVLIVKN